MLPFFRWNLIVITIASNYGCYSVRVFANASKHFDFHQHTGPMELTARQNGVQFVPYREHPVWIRPIRVCTCKFSMDLPCLSVGKHVCGFHSQLGSVVTFFVAFRCRLSSAKSCMSVTDFWTSSSSSSVIVSATNTLIVRTSASWNVFPSVRLFEKVGWRPFFVVSLSVNTVGEWSESRSNSPVTSMKLVSKFLDTKSQLNPVPYSYLLASMLVFAWSGPHSNILWWLIRNKLKQIYLYTVQYSPIVLCTRIPHVPLIQYT